MEIRHLDEERETESKKKWAECTQNRKIKSNFKANTEHYTFLPKLPNNWGISYMSTLLVSHCTKMLKTVNMQSCSHHATEHYNNLQYICSNLLQLKPWNIHWYSTIYKIQIVFAVPNICLQWNKGQRRGEIQLFGVFNSWGQGSNMNTWILPSQGFLCCFEFEDCNQAEREALSQPRQIC